MREDQQKLLFALEKIVNVAKVKTKRGDNNSVKEILNDLERTFRTFWQLKNENPDKFETLLWSRDFFDKYIEPLRKNDLVRDDTEQTGSNQPLEKEAALKLAFNSAREMKGLTEFLISFEKIWICAFTNDNDEISRYVVYHLIWLLSDLTQEEGNAVFVEEVLRLFQSIVLRGIEGIKSKNKINRSIYSTAFQWYISITFKINFNLTYLQIFDRYFFRILQNVISEGQSQIFETFVASIFGGILLPTYNSGKIWNYGTPMMIKEPKKFAQLNQEYKISDRIQKLANSEITINSRENLKKWLKDFEFLKNILHDQFSNKQEAITLEKEIQEYAIANFKFNNLLKLVFAICAYCLFKGKYSYIKYFWEYKQPPDSDASWIGTDVIPKELNQTIELFYIEDMSLGSKFDFHEGHHGSRLYFRQYFLLLLLRILNPTLNYDKHSPIPKIDFPKHFDVYLLSHIENTTEGLIAVTNKLKETEALCVLGFDSKNIDKLIDNRLVSLLKDIKEAAKVRIEEFEKERSISQKKVEQFKDEFIDGFNKYKILRDVFEKNGLIINKTAEDYSGSLNRFGINRVDKKHVFFDEWHVASIDWGKTYGEIVANGENSLIIDEILRNCKTIQEDNLFHELESFDNLSDMVIFASSNSLFRFLKNQRIMNPNGMRVSKN